MSKPKGEPTALDAYMISKGLKSQSSKARPNLKAYMEKSGCTIDLTGDTVRVVKKPVLMDKSIIDLSSNYDLDLKQPGNSEPRKENVPIPANNLGSPGRSFNYGAYSFDSKARISSYKRGPDLLGTTKIKIGKNDGSDKKAKISAELSAEQKVILHAACELKQSMFFTGRAGTGKSFLLTEMIKVFKERIDDALAVTASAGLAAYNIGGVTLHSFAGLGLGIGKPEELIMKAKANPATYRRWLATRVLIIDEISMLNADFFDLVDKVAREIRGINTPFGGIQMILCGDFMQLPPPAPRNEETKFLFETQAWANLKPKLFELNTIFRQKDQQLIKILNEMRTGNMSQESITILQNLITDISPIKSTNLFPLRVDVAKMNELELAKLDGPLFTFKANDWAKFPSDLKKLDAIIAPAVISLKVGARVMLIKNMRNLNLYNGCVGEVKSINEEAGTISVTFKEDGTKRTVPIDKQSFELTKPHPINIYASRSQYPLILAYAMTIHKAQGQTLENVHVDLAKIFEKGQAYVAVSRCTSLKGLTIAGFDPTKVLAHPKVKFVLNRLGYSTGVWALSK